MADSVITSEDVELLSKEEEDADISDAFLQLRHQHDLLRADKKKLEAYFEELSEQSEKDKEMIELLKRKNQDLSHLAKDLSKTSMLLGIEKSEISQEVDLLKRKLSRKDIAPRKSVSENQDNDPEEDDTDSAATYRRARSPQHSPGGYDSRVFTGLDRPPLVVPAGTDTTALRKEIALLEADIKALRLALLEEENRQNPPHSTTPTRVICGQCGRPDPMADQSPHLKAEILRLRDLLEEAQVKIQELKTSQLELTPLEQTTTSIAGELQTASIAWKGMTYEEQILVLQQRNDLKIELDGLSEDLKQSKVESFNNQMTHEKALQYYRQRDAQLVRILSSKKQLTEKQKAELLSFLKTPFSK